MAEQVSTTEDINDLYDNLTGTQKCAILMMLLGEDEAAEIMKNLSPKEVQTLGSAMYSVQGLPQETVNLVLDEFLAIIIFFLTLCCFKIFKVLSVDPPSTSICSIFLYV